MTKPLNIYALSRIREESPFNIVEKHHTQKQDMRRTQYHEMESLRRLVDALMGTPAAGAATASTFSAPGKTATPALSASDMDGFFFSYQIPHIGKEFDLLKITDKVCLNIELKSEEVPEEQIRRQLLRNRYYLSHLDRWVRLYTVVTDTLTCYRLDMPEGRTAGNAPAFKTDGTLVQVDIAEIAEAVKDIGTRGKVGAAAFSSADLTSASSHDMSGAAAAPYVTDIDNLFRASDYLISPMETPGRFIRGEYFLTQAQERVKDLIFAALTGSDSANGTFLHITGRPGTGKTLLLYDIARTLSETDRTLIVHCGKLSDGQRQISKEMPALDILPAEVLEDGAEELDGYRFILVDESHRMQPAVFWRICNFIKASDKTCIFSSDPEQVFSAAERENNITARIRKLPLAGEYELSEKIRANKELLAFILTLKDLHYEPAEPVRYDHIELCYAQDETEARELLACYRGKGYTFINYARPRESHPGTAQATADAQTPRPAGNTPEPATAPAATDPYAAYESDFTSDQIIGREFDDVVMLLDDSFYYDENGRLQGTGALEPDYIYPNLFYHGVTRVRERLALIVVGAPSLFAQIAGIVAP